MQKKSFSGGGRRNARGGNSPRKSQFNRSNSGAKGGHFSGGRSGGSFSGGRGRGGGGRAGGRGNGKKYIDPAKFINHAISPKEEIKYVADHKFSDFALDKRILDNVTNIGFEYPSAIQDQALNFVIEGHDLLGMANTGTGKTAAFLLPIINNLAYSHAEKSVLIMTPTRELAQQIDEEFKKFANGMKLYSSVFVGGANMNRQISALKRRPHVIIGTPGRIGDLIKRKLLNLDDVDTFVLDEVDRMLDMGFVNEIKRIAALLTTARQTLAFSATMTPAIQQLLSGFLKDGYEVVSVATTATNEHIDQNVIPSSNKAEKIDLLKELLAKEEFDKVLVFGETKFGVQRLADSLNNANLSATAIHGNKSQAQRQKALQSFKNGDVQIMVATDVAARGLDIPNVSHVINFDTPNTYEDYVHRIGRTGRGGKSGKALTFVDKK
jgi:superfamily II DNA/RNA helicase